MKISLFLAALFVMASTAAAQEGKSYLTEVQQVRLPDNDPRIAKWQAMLDDQMKKLIAVGHMAPWRVQPGETESYFYFTDPSEMILILARALPYMSAPVRAEAIQYLDKEIAAYPPALVRLLPRDQGRHREIYDLPTADRNFRYQRWMWRSINTRPRMMTFYALWAYAENAGRWNVVEEMYPQLILLHDEQVGPKTNLLEEAIGLAAFSRIANHMGDGERAEKAISTANILLAQSTSFDDMSKRARERYDADLKNQGGKPYTRPLVYPVVNVVPESARFLADTQKDAVRTAVNAQIARWPLWYIPFPPHTDALFGEGTSNAPDEKPNLFQARAMVLGEGPDALEKDLDLPWLALGDVYYIQCLTALIESAGVKTFVPYQPPKRAEAFGSADEQKIAGLRDQLNVAKTATWLVGKPFPKADNPTDLSAAPADAQPATMKDSSIDIKSAIPDATASNVAVLAFMRVWSPAKVDAAIVLRNDDGYAVWVNGKEAARSADGLGWMPGEDIVPVALNEGWNAVLVKVDQADAKSGWALTARFATPTSAPLPGLKYAAAAP